MEKNDDMFGCFDTVLACNGQIDRQTDILRQLSPRYGNHALNIDTNIHVDIKAAAPPLSVNSETLL